MQGLADATPEDKQTVSLLCEWLNQVVAPVEDLPASSGTREYFISYRESYSKRPQQASSASWELVAKT